MKRVGTKRAVESILVAKSNQSLAAPGTLLIDQSTGNVNLADGQLAVIDASGRGTNALTEALAPGDTVADSPVIRLVQGTANSSNVPASIKFPLAVRPYEESTDIVGNNVIVWSGKAYAAPYLSAWVVGANDAASSGHINIEDNSEYILRLGFRGTRIQEFYTSTHGGYGKNFSFTSPEYSTLGLTKSLDHLVKNLAYVVNRNSRQFAFNGVSFGGNVPIMAFAIDSDGGSGVAITSVAGTVVPVVVTPSGITKSVTLTAEMVATFANLVAEGNVPNTATIELINLSTAGAGDCDQLILMAMNEDTAYEDRKPNIKNRLEVGLGGAFESSTVLATEDSKAFEGQGTSRQWTIIYKNTAGQRKYSQYRGFEVIRLDYPVPVVDGAHYDAYIIESFDAHQLSLAGISNSPVKNIILVPTGDTTTKASLEAVLNPYMASTPGAFPAVAL